MPQETIITCKNFIEAVGQDKYGFNWFCAKNGDASIYLHRLSQGYVLQKDKGHAIPEDDDTQTLEEKIEEQRAVLNFDSCTRVTLETFNKWKADKAQKKQGEFMVKVEA
jgi:hypothetical protein